MPHGQGTGTAEADLMELIASKAVWLGEVEAPKAVAIKKAAAAYKVPAKKLMASRR